MKRPARLGIFAVLAGAVALAAGYLNNCFTGLGFAPGRSAGQVEAKPDVVDVTKADAPAKVRVVVQGERCRIDGVATLQNCEDLCNSIQASAAEVEATAGTQGTVDQFKTCLQGRGIKVQVLSE